MMEKNVWTFQAMSAVGKPENTALLSPSPLEEEGEAWGGTRGFLIMLEPLSLFNVPEKLST